MRSSVAIAIAIRVAVAVAVAVAIAAAPARADEIARGVVVRKEGRAVYVNLGHARGITDGAPVRFKRSVSLRHPVTGKRVDDWIPLGTATIGAAGDRLARIVVDDALAAQLALGDLAEIYVEAAVAAPVAPVIAPTATTETEPLPAVDADTASVLAVWARQSARPLDARIAAWEGWLAGHAGSPYADTVRGDLEILRAEQGELAPRRLGLAPVALPGAALDHHAPTRADAGRAIPLVFVTGARAPASAWLHYRTAGAITFRRVLLARDGDVALRGQIPAEVVRPPGVEYFVEASAPSGASSSAFATPGAPQRIEVATPPLADDFAATHRSRLSISTTYLDFANLDRRAGDHVDRVSWTEADILYRVGGSLWGVRAGYGAYRGLGGDKDRAWTAAEPAPLAGFTYGYAEAEVRLPGTRGLPRDLALRAIAGVGLTGVGFGVEVKGRVGDPDATNLSLTIADIAEIGTFSDLRFEAVPRESLYVAMSVGATNQPNRGDLGVRLATDVGWRVRSWLQPTVRVSWQGRSVDHSGVGGGLGLVFDW